LAQVIVKTAVLVRTHPWLKVMVTTAVLVRTHRVQLLDEPGYMKLKYKNLKAGIRMILAAEPGTCLYEKEIKVHAYRFELQLVMRWMNRVHKY
jgi:hypothetical protein